MLFGQGNSFFYLVRGASCNVSSANKLRLACDTKFRSILVKYTCVKNEREDLED